MEKFTVCCQELYKENLSRRNDNKTGAPSKPMKPHRRRRCMNAMRSRPSPSDTQPLNGVRVALRTSPALAPYCHCLLVCFPGRRNAGELMRVKHLGNSEFIFFSVSSNKLPFLEAPLTQKMCARTVSICRR